MDGMFFKIALPSAVIPVVDVRAAATQSPVSCSKKVTTNQKWPAMSFGFSFRSPLKSLWPNGHGGARNNGIALGDAVLAESNEPAVAPPTDSYNDNWVLKILKVRSLRKVGEIESEELDINGGDVSINFKRDKEEQEEIESNNCEGCSVDYGQNDEAMEFDRDSFSKLLKKVPLDEAKLYARLSNLGNLAYCIPRIKETNTLGRYGFHFVTSSFEQRGATNTSGEQEPPPKDLDTENMNHQEETDDCEIEDDGYRISASAAYHAVASAAAYLHSQANGIFPFNSSKENDQTRGTVVARDDGNDALANMPDPLKMASFMATTDSVTSVVAAEEEVKQAVADDLNSNASSPCEWYICDDDQGTRYFVIQGSETLESWKANLLFEPAEFEGMNVPVHRGIYEAAKGMYEQMVPEVRNHFKAHGRRATFRFTGHSLGGSLSLLLNLMLLIRAEVPVSSLLPVVTFGAPCIMCGGDDLLRKLGLPKSHVQAVTMHRDIVPRAFSCNYPNHVAEILKAVNGRFRKHPCLNNLKLLYAPMGELLILQPDEKFSPHHHLLPEGSGLYLLTCAASESCKSEKTLFAAQSVFLNSPHPLEILSDRSAYGTGGTIQRDHDMNSYVKCVQQVVRQDLNLMRKSRRENRRKHWLSIMEGGGVVKGAGSGEEEVKSQANFPGILHVGKESMKRLSRIVGSQHLHILVVLLLPVRLFLVAGMQIDFL